MENMNFNLDQSCSLTPIININNANNIKKPDNANSEFDVSFYMTKNEQEEN